MTYLIKRTYNRHGDYDFLTRMDGDVPVWCGARQFAMAVSASDVPSLMGTISDYRNPFTGQSLADQRQMVEPVVA